MPLAQFIVEHHKDKTKDAVDVPVEFSRALERTITVRRRFAELLETAGAKLDMAADETHSYFVGVLEKVRGALKPLFWQESTTSSKRWPALSPKPAASGATSPNIFDVLRVYESPELDLTDDASAADEQPPVATSRATGKSRAGDLIEYES